MLLTFLLLAPLTAALLTPLSSVHAAEPSDRELDRHFATVNADRPKSNPNADPAYQPYDPDAPEGAAHFNTRSATNPNNRAAKKQERQKRRDKKRKCTTGSADGIN